MPEVDQDWYKKKNWIKFKDNIATFRNGRVSISFQDGVPMFIEHIEGSRKRIELTKEE